MTTTPVAEGVGLFTAGSTFNIPSGTDRVETSGYRAVGKGGGTYFRWSSPLSSLPAVGTGENAWWFTDANGEKWYPDPADLRFEQFGAYVDSTTDDLPAFKAFRSFALWAGYGVNSDFRSLPRLTMPAGGIYSSDSWDFDFGTVHLYADEGGELGGRGCAIKFDSGKSGIRIHGPLTTGNTTRSRAPGATGSTFHGIDVWTPNGTGSEDGWWVRTQCQLIACSAWNFSRHGLNITATSGGASTVEGNANCTRIERGHYHHNGQCGIYLSGADANAGSITGVTCNYNGLWGIWDNSFLGNTIVACHTASNGNEGVGPTYANTTAGTMCTYGGHTYYCIDPTLASTTTPGTNANVWGLLGGASAWPAWTSGKAFVRGGPYAAGGASARSLFVGCYSEADQAPSLMGACSLAVGGEHGAGVLNAFLDTVNGQVRATSIGTQHTLSDGTISSLFLGGNQGLAELGTIAQFGRNSLGITDKFLKMDVYGNIYFDYNHGAGTTYFYILGPNGAVGGRDMAHRFFAIELVLGPADGTSPRTLTFGSTPPTTGTYLVGEIIFNNAPTAGGKVGWVCTSASPLTWKAFGPIDT